jgi:two-component system sensor histidine kinase KdpD
VKEPADVRELVAGALAGIRGPTIDGRKLNVKVKEAIPPADCDASLITKVLRQLVDNSLKCSPAGSPVTISADYTGDTIVMEVANAGPGIPDDEKDRIFEKYDRGHALRSRAPGMGLGLASAKCLVEAHGGAIWVTSPGEGGAVFHFSLPAATSNPLVRR